MDRIMHEDIERLCRENSELFSMLDGKTVMITGATGLIGKTLVYALLRSGKDKSDPVKVDAVVRSREKAERLFADEADGRLTIITADVTQPFEPEMHIDHIIHGASMTSSKAFVEQPTEIIFTAFDGTRNLLETARRCKAESFVYLSTMEVYGAPQTDEKINEGHETNIDTMAVRSSYPESKRLCETMCSAYCSEHGVPTKVLRLTQTFGPGTAYDDGRVFAEFARCAIERRDIVLHTAGTTCRNYLYTADAVTAILTVLLKGENGSAYNAANETSYCSIRDMAELTAKACANGEINVRVEQQDTAKFGYAPTLKMNLDTSKLRALGWKARYSLEDMLQRLCRSMQDSL